MDYEKNLRNHLFLDRISDIFEESQNIIKSTYSKSVNTVKNNIKKLPYRGIGMIVGGGMVAVAPASSFLIGAKSQYFDNVANAAYNINPFLGYATFLLPVFLLGLTGTIMFDHFDKD